MTRTATLAALKALPYISAHYIAETCEYRITLQGLSPDRAEAVACYTDDSADAIGTAQHMSARRVALRDYRDSRSIHVRTLRRWKAALRSTDGNPTIEVLATMPPVEVRRDAVEQACQMARLALVATRQRMAVL